MTSAEVLERGLRARIAKLERQALSYQTAFDAIAQGVSFFDREDRLILSNRRFAEIYRLEPEDIAPGATLREIVELRVAAGTCVTTADDYLSFCSSNNIREEVRTWTAEFEDGRTIQVRCQPTSDGGWVSTHEDITERKISRAAADELLSLQALIDRLPDNLWVKDVKSRFVIANEVTAQRMGLAGPADLIGKTDLELLSPEIARKFFDDEQRIVLTGEPMVDFEECVFGATGGRTWISTTKVPLRNERNEIFGVAGISRDITERRLGETMREGQAQIIEMIAMGAPLEDVLEHLVHLVESQFRRVIGSALLLDGTWKHSGRDAAQSLLAAHREAVDGLCIGPNAGPTGEAACRQEALIVVDIKTDPPGVDHRDFAAAHGLHSCWSKPILSHEGAVLGTFAICSKESREPEDAELRVIDVATRIAGIAIERKLAEDRIHLTAGHDAR